MSDSKAPQEKSKLQVEADKWEKIVKLIEIQCRDYKKDIKTATFGKVWMNDMDVAAYASHHNSQVCDEFSKHGVSLHRASEDPRSDDYIDWFMH